MSHEPVEKFWMVWGANRNVPTYRHETKASAEEEAKRLAEKRPDELFFVLAAVGAYCAPVEPVQKVALVKTGNGLSPIIADRHIPF